MAASFANSKGSSSIASSGPPAKAPQGASPTGKRTNLRSTAVPLTSTASRSGFWHPEVVQARRTGVQCPAPQHASSSGASDSSRPSPKQGHCGGAATVRKRSGEGGDVSRDIGNHAGAPPQGVSSNARLAGKPVTLSSSASSACSASAERGRAGDSGRRRLTFARQPELSGETSDGGSGARPAKRAQASLRGIAMGDHAFKSVGSASLTEDSAESSPCWRAQHSLPRAQEEAVHDARRCPSSEESPSGAPAGGAQHMDGRLRTEVSSPESSAPSEASAPVGQAGSAAQSSRGHRLRPAAELAPKASSRVSSAAGAGAAGGGLKAAGWKVISASSAVRARGDQRVQGEHRIAAQSQRSARQGTHGSAPLGWSAGADAPRGVPVSPSLTASASERSLSTASPPPRRSSSHGPPPAVQWASPERRDAGAIYSSPLPVGKVLHSLLEACAEGLRAGRPADVV